MATETIATQYESAADIYLSVFNEAGEVFDWASNTFVALALPPVDPFFAVTERPGTGGDGESDYWASLDLELLNPAASREDMRIKFFEQQGGSPDLAADTVIAISDLSVIGGAIYSPDTLIECLFDPVYRAGEDTLFMTVGLRVNGAMVTLDPAATCTITVRQIAPFTGADLWSVGPSVPNADGLFVFAKLFPTLNESSSVYRARIEIDNAGTPYTFDEDFPGYA